MPAEWRCTDRLASIGHYTAAQKTSFRRGLAVSKQSQLFDGSMIEVARIAQR